MEFPEAPEGYELVEVKEREKTVTSKGVMHVACDVTYRKIKPEPRTATIYDIGHWVEHDPKGRVRLIHIDMGWAWYQDGFGQRQVCLAAELKTTVPLGWRNVQVDDKVGVGVRAGRRDPAQCSVGGKLVAQGGRMVGVLEDGFDSVNWLERELVWVYGRVES